MKEQWKLIVSLIFVILIVIFSLSNTQQVAIDFLFMKAQIPLVLVILVCLLLGVALGMIVSVTTIRTSRKTIKHLESELAQSKERVTQLNADLVTAQETQVLTEVTTPSEPTEITRVTDFFKEN